MVKTIIRSLIVITFTSLLFCACNGRKPLNISNDVISDVPCYNADSRYNITVKQITVEEQKKLDKYGLPVGCYENKIIYINNIIPKQNDEETIGVCELLIYDTDTNELSVLCSEKNDISQTARYKFILAAAGEIYFFKSTLSQSEPFIKTELCKVDSKSKTLKSIHTYADTGVARYPDDPVFLSDAVYFEEIVPDPDGGGYSADIYKYDIKNDTTVCCIENAEAPGIFSGEIAYYRDGAFYINEEKVLEPNKENEEKLSKISFDEDIIAYTYPVMDEENDFSVGGVFGVFDRSFERKDILSSAPGSFNYFFDHYIFEKNIALETEKYPIIYNAAENKLYKVDIDGERYKMFTFGDTLIVFTYVFENDKIVKDTSPNVYYIN